MRRWPFGAFWTRRWSSSWLGSGRWAGSPCRGWTPKRLIDEMKGRVVQAWGVEMEMEGLGER